MITVKDFDEIVVNNSFLTNGNVGYGIRKWFWQFEINYNPDSLYLTGQSNSTCNYIIIKNSLTNDTYKVIREDKEIEIQEIYPQQDYAREIVTDPKKLSRIERKFNDLKSIVKKQIKKYNATLNSIQQSKINFDYDTIQEFLQLLTPLLRSSQQDKLINELKGVEKSPLSYIDESTASINSNSREIINAIFFKVLVENLSNFGTLLVVDCKSSYEEVIGLFRPVLSNQNIVFDKKALNKPSNYKTIEFVNRLINILNENKINTYSIGAVSDTPILVFTEEDLTFEIKAKQIELEFRKGTIK